MPLCRGRCACRTARPVCPAFTGGPLPRVWQADNSLDKTGKSNPGRSRDVTFSA